MVVGEFDCPFYAFREGPFFGIGVCHVPPFMLMSAEDQKIPLPSFLKILTSNNVSVPKAMAAAGKM